MTPQDVPEIVSETIKLNKVVERLLYSDAVNNVKATREADIPFYKHQERNIIGNNIKIDPKCIDDYLALCAERGEEPDRPFNGKILLRTEPALHRKAAIRAAADGLSLSQWIARQIEAA